MCTCSFLWNREYFIVTIPSPEKYPRLSEAIAGGLYHPNCKDIHTTYFEGVTTPPKPMTDAEKKEAARVYNLEQQQRYNERQIRKYKRLSNGSVDPENQHRYQKKLEEWQAEQKRFVKSNGDVLKRRYENEAIHGIGPIDNADTRRTVESMRREVEFERLQALKKDLTSSGNSDIIGLPDIQIGRSVGAKALNYDVLDPSTREYFKFAEGTKIQNAEVFAGSGTKKPLAEEVVEGLTIEFGGEPSKWQHAKGTGYLDCNGIIEKAEVHWFQESTVGKVKFKVKEWLE